MYLAAQIDGKTTGENYLVEVEAIYVDLNDLTDDMVEEFMAKSGISTNHQFNSKMANKQTREKVT